MKSVIPFSKELDFSGKLSEITSISLEREFEVLQDVIEGNLFVTGDYKSHEISANVIPFSFKIPFSIEIPNELDHESVSLEISDFAYDIVDESKIKVNIELELDGTILEVVEEEEEAIEPVEVDTEAILKMMEERKEEEKEEEIVEEIITEEIVEENVSNLEENTSILNEETLIEDNILEEEHEKVEEKELEERTESEEVIIDAVTNEEEYATYHIHIVKEGESIETICTMYNSNLNLLSEYNDVSQIASLDKLIIPCSDES